MNSMPSGGSVVDKSWVDGVSLCKAPFEGGVDLLAVRERAEMISKEEAEREATYLKVDG